MRLILWSLISIALLTGCSNLNTSAIRNTDSNGHIRDGGILIGKVRYLVDGEVLQYHLLNRPALYLARNDLQAYFATPEADETGSFIWSLPAGEYEVAVIFGGLPGKTSYWWRKDGLSQMVNGITNPHILLTTL